MQEMPEAATRTFPCLGNILAEKGGAYMHEPCD